MLEELRETSYTSIENRFTDLKLPDKPELDRNLIKKFNYRHLHMPGKIAVEKGLVDPETKFASYENLEPTDQMYSKNASQYFMLPASKIFSQNIEINSSESNGNNEEIPLKEKIPLYELAYRGSIELLDDWVESRITTDSITDEGFLNGDVGDNMFDNKYLKWLASKGLTTDDVPDDFMGSIRSTLHDSTFNYHLPQSEWRFEVIDLVYKKYQANQPKEPEYTGPVLHLDYEEDWSEKLKTDNSRLGKFMRGASQGAYWKEMVANIKIDEKNRGIPDTEGIVYAIVKNIYREIYSEEDDFKDKLINFVSKMFEDHPEIGKLFMSVINEEVQKGNLQIPKEKDGERLLQEQEGRDIAKKLLASKIENFLSSERTLAELKVSSNGFDCKVLSVILESMTAKDTAESSMRKTFRRITKRYGLPDIFEDENRD